MGTFRVSSASTVAIAGIVLAIVAWANPQLGPTARAVLLVFGGILGAIPLLFGDLGVAIPKLLRSVATLAWCVLVGSWIHGVFAEPTTDIAIAAVATLAGPSDSTATPPPQANGIAYIPSDSGIDSKLAQESVRLGYGIASSPIKLTITISNKGPKAWAAFKIPLTIHYVILHGIPLDLDWSARGSVDQSYLLSNGRWSLKYPNIPIFLDQPINSYTTISVVLINTSIAYAYIEFPKNAEVEEVGSNDFIEVPLALSGIQMLAPTLFRTEMLPPWRFGPQVSATSRVIQPHPSRKPRAPRSP